MLKPLVKGLQLAVMVECPSCLGQTELGAEKCWNCSALLNLDGALMNIVIINMGDRYTPLIECPNCIKLVRVGVRRCPECYEEIPEPYALESAFAIVRNTIACDTAASIQGGDAFAPIAVILTGLSYLANAYLFHSAIFNIAILFYPLLPLLFIALWFYRFGSLGMGDKDYLTAKRRLKGSLLLWLTILVVQCLAVAALLEFNN